MFQNFDDVADPDLGAARVADLRAELKSRGLNGFIVPRTDEYQGEYVAAYAERLAWLTGFTGSSGYAVIFPRRAVLFVDGRYTIQAGQQVDTGTFEILVTPERTPISWVGENIKKGNVLGYDPRLTTIREVRNLKKATETAGGKLAPVKSNPIDAIWRDQPPPPRTIVQPQPLKYAGVKSQEKLRKIASDLKSAGEDATVLSDPLSIAWAFNIRGQDVPHTPVSLATAILYKKGRADLFIAGEKLERAAKKHLKPLANIHEPEELSRCLTNLGKAKATVRVDPDKCPAWIADVLSKRGAAISEKRDLCLLPRALKNASEISGARAAHLRDGAAVVRFLSWLGRQKPDARLTEIAAAQKLENFRAETGALKEISFDTISGAGPNGAIVHYRVTRATDRRLKSGELYLVDSGGQYLDGTTDITRTIAIGRPSSEMVERFTLVLKGHIALASARFPYGTRGVDLDILARRHLWQAGLDYDHGTGHGVGSYLAVHEGPQNISKRGMTRLEPGMIISNEPGYYKEGAYGIRIENLVLVHAAEPVRGGERPMMRFETLTLAPIDRTLINVGLLEPAELKWLNDYHKTVRKLLVPGLRGDDLKWLREATAPCV